MSENHEIDETIEAPEITDESIQDFINRGGEAPSYHPILEVWREVLKPAKEDSVAKVSPQWANRMVSSYKGLRYSDMNKLRDNYYGKLAQLVDILNDEIDGDEDCLTPTTAAEDVEQNTHHYKNLLLTWQLAFLQWELDWDTMAPDAEIELAAISEIHKIFFGDTGITAYLDQIGFVFTEDDQEMLAEALRGLKEGQ